MENSRVEDYITILSLNGTFLEEYSISELLNKSAYARMLKRSPKMVDHLHTNTLKVFDGSLADLSPFFKKGNVMVSVLRLSMVAIIDLDAREVVWAQSGYKNGMWKVQHEPTLLDNGNMLLFDNKGENDKNKGYNVSKVIEFQPFTMKTVWQYAGNETNRFFSSTCGTSQRLPNGNTLIAESDSGRAFEVTPDNKIVWEYLNPHRAGEKNELIATLFHMTRLNYSTVKWVERKKADKAKTSEDITSPLQRLLIRVLMKLANWQQPIR